MRRIRVGILVATSVACLTGQGVAASCKQWDLSGSFVLPLNDGTTIVGNITQSGGHFKGSANSFSSKRGVKPDSGPLVAGAFGGDGVNGTAVNFEIIWQARGRQLYEGNIKANGVLNTGIGPVRGNFQHPAKCLS